MKKRILDLKKSALHTTALKRRTFFMVADVVFIAVSMYAAYLIRFDGRVPASLSRFWFVYIALALAIKLGFLAVFGQYRITWRFYGLNETIKLVQALALSSLTLAVLAFFLRPLPPFEVFPRSVILLDFLITLGLLGSLRISKRAAREFRFLGERQGRGRTRILIVGAGSAGEQIGREMLSNRRSTYFPVGYVDDDPAKKGIAIHGVRVLGTRADIPEILKNHNVDSVLVAIPSGSSREIRDIVDIVRKANHVKSIKILPGLMNIISGEVTLSDIQEVQVEDLLGREPVTIDFEAIRKFLAGKRVLVTGAGGSIGSELVRTILPFKPKKLAILDTDETELFHLVHRLQPASLDMMPIVGDIRDRAKMKRVFESFRPEVVIHSAAYKHVPVLEAFPEEAVMTNVLGTKILGETARANGAETFVNISTDKAINPISVMGATKRLAEEMLRALNDGKDDGATKFISVRFGNVLGSRGSVIPLFKEQILKGGPVTVTHPDMKRYFMAVSEAVLLVLEAAAFGEGGETFVLDMGEPVKIIDLARDMIRLSRLEPDADIPIVFIGLRPGEKLFEELLDAEEGSEPTHHPKIYKVRSSRRIPEKPFWEAVERMIDMCRGGSRMEEISRALKDVIATYHTNGTAHASQGGIESKTAAGTGRPQTPPRASRRTKPS